MWRYLFSFIRRYWKWIVAAEALWLVIWFLGQGLTMEAQVEKRKERFRTALQEQNVDKALAMVSENYHDQWGFTKEELRLVLHDVTSQFVFINLAFSDEQLSRQNGTLLFRTRIRLDGRPLTPAGTVMADFSAEHREPFVLTWKKEGWWPWNWRLVKVESPELEIPSAYQPGMFSQQSFQQLLEQAGSSQN